MDKLTGLITENFGQDIVSLLLIGSKRGISDPNHSDIDLLLLTKNKSSWEKISKAVREAERENIKIKHSQLTNFLERNFLGSNDLRGVHLMLFSKEEFGENFEPKSLRLKFITSFFISRAIFMILVKENYKVLFGVDIPSRFKPVKVGFKDRFLTSVLPCFVLFSLPIAYFDKNNFKMWCLKAAKYHLESVEGYLQIKYGKTLAQFKSPHIDNKVKDWLKKYRYYPESWNHNLLGIYFFVWKVVLGNVPFILRGAVSKN